MADRTLRRLLAKARENHVGRSEAYCWLRARFEHLYPLLERRRLTYQQVADDLVLGGKRGGRGKPMTADAARRIWHRVQRDVAAEEPRRMDTVRIALQHGTPAQKPRSPEPERGASADRPPVVATPAPRPPVPSYPVPPPPRPTATEDDADEQARGAEANRKIHRLRCVIAERSGHSADDVIPLPGTNLEEAARIAAEVRRQNQGR